MPADYITTLDPVHAWLKITDDDICNSELFEGHGPVFLKWPPHLWRDWSKGIPNEAVDKNAYHVKYLAEIMRAEGRWIGPPLRLWEGAPDQVEDGNHRYRAVQYLRDRLGISIEVPVDEHRVPRP
jgi:hypothetical protein